VERFFAETTNKCIRRSAHRSVNALKNAIMNYLDEHTGTPSLSLGSPTPI
jgi:hypothetical protein